MINEETKEMLNGLMEDSSTEKIGKVLSVIIEKIDDVELSKKSILTVEEAARYTGYSEQRLKHFARTKQISSCKPMVGGSCRAFFKREDLDAFLTQYRSESNFELQKKANDYLMNR